MKRILKRIEEMLTEAALLEAGVGGALPTEGRGAAREPIGENLVEVAFAKAADYDDIHSAILREHREERDISHPDDGGEGDNELCFA